MADKGWTSQVATAAGAAAGTGAAQLGLGYGLGVVVWPVAATPDDNVWLGSLGWATWIAASATVIGAVIASRLPGGPSPRLHALWRLTLATSASVGALVAVALIALPARSAVRADTFSPQITAAGYALLGVVLGLFVAYWAIVSRPVAANLMGTAVWLWALAIAAIVVELTAHRTSATYLTSWQFAEAVEGFRYGSINWPSGLLTLAAAFLVGIAAAAPAARRGDFGVGATISGAVGPLVVAAAFLALAPQLTGTLGPLESAYLIAPYAVLAGLAGSATTVALGRAAADRRARRAEAAAAATATPSNAAGEDDRWNDDSRKTDRGKDEGKRDEAGRDTGRRGLSWRGTSRRGADRKAADEQTATGIAAVPAADPVTAPPAATQKTKAEPTTGRAKSPTQPAPVPAQAADSGSDSSSPPENRPTSRPAPEAKAGAGAGGKSQAGASAPKSGARNGQSRSPAAAVDPEIAAAARPSRPRPKQPAPAEAPKPKSTVTPPPSDPAIARINPKADS